MLTQRQIRRKKGVTCFLLGTLNMVFQVIFDVQELRPLNMLYLEQNNRHNDTSIDNQFLMYGTNLKNNSGKCEMFDNFKINHPDIISDLYFYSQKLRLMSKCSQVGVRQGFFDHQTSIFFSPIDTKEVEDHSYNFLEQVCLFEKIYHLPILNSSAGNFIQTIAIQQEVLHAQHPPFKISQQHYYFREAYKIDDVDSCRFIARNKLDGRSFYVILDEEFDKQKTEYSLFVPSVCNRTNIVFPISVMSIPKRPFTHNARKVQFTAFYFLASTNNFIGYIYDKLLMNVCLEKFSLTEFNHSIHNCSIRTHNDLNFNLTLEEKLNQTFKDPFQQWSFRYSFEDTHRGRSLDNRLNKQLAAKLFATFLDKISQYMENHLKAVSDSRASDLYEIKFTIDHDFHIYIDEVILSVSQNIRSKNRDSVISRLYRDSMLISEEYLNARLSNYLRYEKRKTMPLSDIITDKVLSNTQIHDFHYVEGRQKTI